MRPAHAAFDERNGLLSPLRIGCPALGIGTRNGIDAQLAKLSVEKTVIRATTEFTVSRELEAQPLLQGRRVHDRRVFRVGQIGLRNLSTCEALTLLQQRSRPQQTADVLGTKRRLLTRDSASPHVHDGKANGRAPCPQRHRAF